VEMNIANQVAALQRLSITQLRQRFPIPIPTKENPVEMNIVNELRLDVGATPEKVRYVVAQMPDVKVVAGTSLFTSVRQVLTALLQSAVVLTLLVPFVTVLSVGVMFSAIIAEGRAELGLLLALGTRRRQLVRLILAAAMIVITLGGLATCVGLVGIAPIPLPLRDPSRFTSDHDISWTPRIVVGVDGWTIHESPVTLAGESLRHALKLGVATVHLKHSRETARASLTPSQLRTNELSQRC